MRTPRTTAGGCYPNGFSLLELGIVLAITTILLAALAPSMRSHIESARLQRTVGDVEGLLSAAQTWWQRAELTLGCAPDAKCTASVLEVLTDGTPLVGGGRSIDLSTPDGRAMFSGVLPQGQNGLSVFGTPYHVVIAARRVSASVCVPSHIVDGVKLLNTRSPMRIDCKACGADECLLEGYRTRPPGRMPNLMMTRKYLYWGQ